MKRILLLLAVFILVPQLEPRAAIDSTTQTGDFTGDSTWESGTAPAASTDTLIVLNGHTLYLNKEMTRRGNSDTTCLVLFVRDGGTADFVTGEDSSRINVGALWLGDYNTDLFGWTGGDLNLYGGDTIGLWNTNVMGADDFNFRGADCDVVLQGASASSRAVVMGLEPGPYIFNNQSNGDFTAIWTKFFRLGEQGRTALDFQGPTAAQLTIDSCWFDSTGGIIMNADNLKMTSCTVATYYQLPSPIAFYSGADSDTLQNWVIDSYHGENSGGNSNALIGASNCDNMAILDCELHAHGPDTTNDNGVLYCVAVGNASGVIIKGTTMDSAVWNVGGAGPDNLTIAGCTIRYGGHIGLYATNDGDGDKYGTGWRIFNNYIYGTYPLPVGYPITSYYSNANNDTIADVDNVFAFNTIVADLPGDEGGFAINFGGAGDRSGIKLSGFDFVGNIWCNDAASVRIRGTDIHIVTNNNGWSSNYFDSLLIEGTSELDSTGNGNVDGDTPDFLDSLNGDFRLSTSSALLAHSNLITSDSDWCDTGWALMDSAGSPNYNIGAYQGTGESGETDATIFGPATIGAGVTIAP